MYLIDTNIFLEIMLSRDRERECKEFLKMVRRGDFKAVVTDFTIHSILVLMDRFERRDELKIFLASLTKYKSLYIYYTSIWDELKAIDISKDMGLDIDDAIQYTIALKIKAKAIVSFDRDFDNLDIPRVEPNNVIKNIGSDE